MKKIIFLLAFVSLVYAPLHSQSFLTTYMPGFQFSRFHGTDIRYNNSQRGNINGKINHILFKGDGIADHFICGIDVSLILRGLLDNRASYYGSGFEVRMGYAPSLGDKAKLGAAVDVGYRGFRYRGDTVFVDDYSYAVFGGTIVGLYNIGETIYIMPKLSLDPIFSKNTDKVVDGFATKFEISAGFRFAGAFGISITPGFERLKFNYEDHSGSEDVIKASYIKTKFLQVGISLSFD
jgi:hypothetical protein